MAQILERDLIERACALWNVPGVSIFISSDGTVLQQEAVGVRDWKRNLPADTKTRFCIASCTKSFTTAIALMLQERGMLDIDRPLCEYIPDFRIRDELAGRQICLRDMFLHRTGLAPHEFTWPYYEIDDREYLNRLRYLDMESPFRKETSYNNVMYILAGYIESIVAKKSWAEMVREMIFEPIGMHDSYVSLEEAAKFGEKNLSCAYRESGGHWEELCSIAPKARASGSIVSTARDLGKWLKFQLDGKSAEGRTILSSESRRQLHRPQVVFGEKTWGFEASCMPICYGLGWFVRDYRNVRVVYHHGGTMGGCSLQAFIEEKNICFSALVNLHGAGAAFLDGLLFTAVDRLLGLEEHDWIGEYAKVKNTSIYEKNYLPESTAPVVESTPGREWMKMAAGRYRNDGYGEIEIVFDTESGFRMKFKNKIYKLEHHDGLVYRVSDMRADTEFYVLPVSFHMDGQGDVVDLEIPFERRVEPIIFSKQTAERGDGECLLIM